MTEKVNMAFFHSLSDEQFRRLTGVKRSTFKKMQHKDTKVRRHKERRRDLTSNHQPSIEVHRTLGGPGLLESIYEAALCHELILRGLRVHRQRFLHI